MIDYRFDNRVARLTLNTPQTGNRFTRQLMLDFIAGIRKAAEQKADVLVIDAKGDDFTLGRDQSERLPDVPLRQNLGLILEANAALRNFPGVSIALIQGPALGFGSGLALHSTISLAVQSAQFGFDEIAHNLAPLIVAAYLPYFIPPRAAEELLLTGRRVDAEEALRLGLISRIVADDALQSSADALIESLLHSSAAARVIRRYTQRLPGYPSAELSRQAVEDLALWVEQGKP
ncbi:MULTISPECIES: enoyl-CoA hydratase/isomerase family protein [unclassified Brenneria]|uniref:enoyl-CoA hydratase/isomerase family protein n=1 Tax=unclassified Brenneria TaxID=2634434 RepID=UPI0029C5F519|nr:MULTISPECIES: enoyl-CoA hydratase/isomerase family protein [unclassified Brenneria]MDX5628366.1 enoyl-CoA hydratase/isomerase family protein [Brenneria sp. L3-3Z]MDX5695451.1 enoyl-CoA hydratase/isomerase family protein [Brenneria sp. L4-2C]